MTDHDNSPAEFPYRLAALGAPGNPAEMRRCLALVPALVDWVSKTTAADDTPVLFDLITRVVVLLLKNQMGGVAVPLAERAVRSSEIHIGARALQTLTVKSNLASAYEQAGEPQHGARLLEKVIADLVAELGPDHPRVWERYVNLGGIYLRAGQFAESEAVVGRILAHQQANLGPHARATLMTRNNLACVMEKAGRLTEAIALWEEVVTESETHLGPQDPDTIAFSRALALARQAEGDRDTSLAEFDDRITRLIAARGIAATETIAAQVERATALRDQGRLAEAADAFDTAITVGGTALGPGHPILVSARYRLARAHDLMGAPERAIAVARESLDLADQNLGRNHHETLIAAATLMALLNAYDHADEHLALLEDRMADIIEGLGFEDPLVRAMAKRRAFFDLGRPSWG